MAFALGGCLVSSLPGCARRESPKPQASREEAREPAHAVSDVRSDPAFLFQVDSFANVRLLRYKVHNFDALSLQQKQLAYALHEATLSGRDASITSQEKQNLRARRTLEALVASYSGDRSAASFQALLTYAKRVWFSAGLTDVRTGKRLAPEGFTREDFIGFVRASDEKRLPLLRSADARTTAREPNKEARSPARVQNKDGIPELLESVLPLIFAGDVTRGTAYEADLPPQEVWLERVRFLEQALGFAENETQAQALSALLAFYRTGRAADWERYRDALRADEEAKVVPLFEGPVSPAAPPGRMRALLGITDAEASRRVASLLRHAAWFEDQLPISNSYKTKNFVGRKTRVLEAIVVLGDTAGTLAPADGARPAERLDSALFADETVLLSNLREASTEADRELHIIEEFAENAREIQRDKQHQVRAQAVLAELRAVLKDLSLPASAEASSREAAPLEDLLRQTRSELIALYYMLDPKLVALNVLSSLEVGRNAYDHAIREGLLVQLAAGPLDAQVEAPNPTQLIARWAYTQGKADNVIERVERGGKSYVVVRDYVRLRALFAELLREIQRTLLSGSPESAHELLAAAAFPFDAELHKQVRERYQSLKVAPYVGFLDPELIPVKKADDVVDVRIDYQSDFVKQQLRYAARYTFLKAERP